MSASEKVEERNNTNKDGSIRFVSSREEVDQYV